MKHEYAGDVTEGCDSQVWQVGITRLPEELDGADERDVELARPERLHELGGDGARELDPGLLLEAPVEGTCDEIGDCADAQLLGMCGRSVAHECELSVEMRRAQRLSPLGP